MMEDVSIIPQPADTGKVDMVMNVIKHPLGGFSAGGRIWSGSTSGPLSGLIGFPKVGCKTLPFLYFVDFGGFNDNIPPNVSGLPYPPSVLPLMGETQDSAANQKTTNPFDLPYESDVEHGNMVYRLLELYDQVAGSSEFHVTSV